MFIRGRSVISLYLLSMLFVCTQAVGEQSSAQALHCATNEFAPFAYHQDGEVKGVEVEVVKALGEQIAIDIDVSLMPWKRLLAAIKEGQIDCMFAVFKTPERETYMDYTNVPIHVSSLYFYARGDSDIQFNSLDDIQGRTVSLIRGYRTSDAFERNVEAGLIRVEHTADYQQSFKMLVAGRVDLVLVNREVGEFTRTQLGLKHIKRLPKPFAVSPAYLTFSKKKHLGYLIPKVNAALAGINNIDH